jgi:hypothetical protein
LGLAVIKVDATKVMDTLRTVVAERPDYVYEAPEELVTDGASCFYVHGDAPGCLVGQVLNRLGVPLTDMERYEGTGAYSLLPHVVELTGDPDAADDVATALTEAQYQQDQGVTWSKALELATRRIGE